tara:strand:+ start:861 stop:1067 length:207 start_codon:yes stop_codon:yes gene_type:complete
MNVEDVKSEIERLTNDKAQTDATIVSLQKELDKLKDQSNMLSGALQTCNYFLNKLNNDVEVDKEDEDV